jgi:Zn-dependent protease with chaperone function
MVGTDLFVKPYSLRAPRENFMLGLCTVCAPTAIAFISLIFPSVSFSEFVLFIVGGMLFVSVSRGRLLGSSIRIEGRQLPEIQQVADEVAARLGMHTPTVFVRDDPSIPIAAVGVGEPYALIISSQYYEHLRRGELKFLIARELGHIAAGHVRITSLLSASGRENPIVALVFGSWLRLTEYTADRVGLLCCDGLQDALGGIAITTFHAIGRHVDLAVLSEQRRDLMAEPMLRMGEWLSGVPYATNRLEALRAFNVSPLAAQWRTALAAPRPPVPVEAAQPAGAVAKRDCAPVFRRVAAAVIDYAVVAAILKTPFGAQVSDSATKISDADLSELPAFLKPLVAHGNSHVHWSYDPAASLAVVAFFVYSAILVASSGQTLGMMVMELRVVTTRFARPGLLQILWRYIAAFGSTLVVIGFFLMFLRIQPHDRVSGTRLIRGRKAA